MEEDKDEFKLRFKYFKSRKPPPDLSHVLDFEKISEDDNTIQSTRVTRFMLHELRGAVPLGLKPVSQWQTYTLDKHPGFVFIQNPFSPGYQRYWIKRCLEDYHQPPNVTNLDAHMDREETSKVFEMFVKKNRDELHKDDLLTRLRWVTLGYHYDWTAKRYYADKLSEFPSDMALLASCIAQATGYKNFSAEAGIVNYYHLDSTLAGHTDHSEYDLEAPLISISFGQDAVFLLGGTTKSICPTAMYLHSGDICVMGGQSRMAYHAVPRIIPAPQPAYLETHESSGEITLSSTNDSADITSMQLNERIEQAMININWTPIAAFLKSSRINVNIRQVLRPGQTFPSTEDESQKAGSCCDTTSDHLEPCLKKKRIDSS